MPDLTVRRTATSVRSDGPSSRSTRSSRRPRPVRRSRSTRRGWAPAVAAALVVVAACSSSGSNGSSGSSVSTASTGGGATTATSAAPGTTARSTATTAGRGTGTTVGSGGAVHSACADEKVTRDTSGGGESISYGATTVVDCATPHDAGQLLVDLVADPDPDGPGGAPGLDDACRALLEAHPPQGLPAGASPELTEKAWSADVDDDQDRGTLTCTVLFGDVQVTSDPFA